MTLAHAEVEKNTKTAVEKRKKYAQNLCIFFNEKIY